MVDPYACVELMSYQNPESPAEEPVLLERLIEWSVQDTDPDTIFFGITRVSILFKNDNTPTITNLLPPASIPVPENITTPSWIYTFLGEDLDLGVDGEFYFLLEETDSTAVFSLDSSTGRLYVIQSLDYETQTNYSIRVTIRDNGDILV